MINIKNDTTFQNILISAVRYALKRHTYIVEDTANFIKEHLDILEKNTITVLIRDIEENIKENNCMIDLNVWNELLNILKNMEENYE